MNNKIRYRNNEHCFNEKKIDAASGALFWSIEGTNVQFTWFDVPAHTNFQAHKHESEQITFLLEGELFFETNNSVYKLSKGDCILIPGNTAHRVWTENTPAKAVDAWAPVNKTYILNKNKKYSHEK